MIADLADLVGDVRRASRAAGVHQCLVRSAIVVGPIVALLATAGASAAVPGSLALAILALASVCAARPESRAGLVLIAVLVWRWIASVDDVRTPWVLVAAAGVLLHHVAMALAATGPSTLRWHPTVLRRWARRSLVVAALTCAVWAGIRVALDVRVDGGATVLVVATVLIAAGALAARARSLPG